MEYLNKNYVNAINHNKKFKDAIDIMMNEVDTFYETFHDDPKINSEWGHNYFCDYDGGRLIFDLNKPHQHVCSVCGKTFQTPIYDGVWVYFYRNTAVLTAWKAAGIYAYNKNPKYLEVIKTILGYYARHYKEFKIHNKEREVFDNYESMNWGCGRILPQGLNESIIAIRMIQTLEIVKNDLEPDFINALYNDMFHEMFLLLKPQVNQIHNIRCWNNSAIGLIGLFYHDQEMLDFVFNGEFNIRRQILTGVTEDGFWYEGSIHYNFFTLEGITPLILFSKIYGYDFGKEAESKVENMFISAYHYAFNNHFFPNPNDGWPSINLKTYSYIYHVASKCFGEQSPVFNILKNIENYPGERTTLPLSKPYYIFNEIAYERLLLNTDMNMENYTKVIQETRNFPKSNFAMLRNDCFNIFVKYGLNGPSHAHKDLINMEVMYKNNMISRDISNAGYVAKLCKEWHRKSLAHNTIIRNGCDIESTSPGLTLEYDKTHIKCEAPNVYQGVDYIRDISLRSNGFKDTYSVKGNVEAIYDYVFHLESDISLKDNLDLIDGDILFKENGYEHIQSVKKINKQTDEIIIEAIEEQGNLSFTIESKDKEVFILKTLDNPVNKQRTTILIRSKSISPTFELTMEVK